MHLVGNIIEQKRKKIPANAGSGEAEHKTESKQIDKKEIKPKSEKSSHGGKREGAGRKPKKPLDVLMRVERLLPFDENNKAKAGKLRANINCLRDLVQMCEESLFVGTTKRNKK